MTTWLKEGTRREENDAQGDEHHPQRTYPASWTNSLSVRDPYRLNTNKGWRTSTPTSSHCLIHPDTAAPPGVKNLTSTIPQGKYQCAKMLNLKGGMVDLFSLSLPRGWWWTGNPDTWVSGLVVVTIGFPLSYPQLYSREHESSLGNTLAGMITHSGNSVIKHIATIPTTGTLCAPRNVVAYFVGTLNLIQGPKVGFCFLHGYPPQFSLSKPPCAFHAGLEDEMAHSLSSPRKSPPRSMAERLGIIFEAFETKFTRLTLDDVVDRTSIPRSSAHRILDQLIDLGWLQHTPEGYAIGARAQKFRDKKNETNVLRAEASSVLEYLHIKSGLIVHLATLEGPYVHYLDRCGCRLATSIPSRVGEKRPAHATALGKSILAWLSPEKLDTTLPHRLPKRTNNTITSIGQLYTELDQIRKRGGIAFDFEESVQDISCVGVAIHHQDQPVGAISITGVKPEQVQRLAPMVYEAAQHISHTLTEIR